MQPEEVIKIEVNVKFQESISKADEVGSESKEIQCSRKRGKSLLN